MIVTGRSNIEWNDQIASVASKNKDDEYLLSIHKDNDLPEFGTTVKMTAADLKAFAQMCLHLIDTLEGKT